MTNKIKFTDLDQFTQGYINAALILSADSDEEFSEYYNFINLSKDSLDNIINDCLLFQDENKAFLNIAEKELGFSYHSAGNDYWLTRNGHGAGYWDRDLGEIGEILTKKAKEKSESYLYISDKNECEVYSNLNLSNKIKP